MTQLREKDCKPCEGGVLPLPTHRITQYMEQVPGWQADNKGLSINRKFEFKGFLSTMSFINALAWIANQQGHHPELSAGYNYCDVTFTTHAIDGLSENDFICASRVSSLVES